MESLSLYLRFFWIFLALVLTAVPVAASNKPHTLTAHDYGSLPQVQMMSISPDGTMVAFRKTTDHHDRVLLFSLSKNKFITGVDVSAIMPHLLYFVNNNDLILVASDYRRLLGYRGHHDISTAFAVNTHTGKIEQLLLPGDNIYKGQTGLGSIVGMSADESYVYMPAFVGRSKYDQNPEYSLMRVDLSSPRHPHVQERGDENTIDYFVSDKGEMLAQEVYDNKDNLHTIEVPDGDDWRIIYKAVTDVIGISLVGLTPDLKSLVVLKENEKTGRESYYLMSLKDGSYSKPMFSKKDTDVERVLTDINRVVRGVVYSGFSPTYKFFDDAVNSRVKAFAKRFEGQSVWLKSWSNDWKSLVFYVEGASSSGEYYIDQQNRAPRFLAASRPTIKRQDINPIVKTHYLARDGLTIPTLLTIPKKHQNNPHNLPAIILPHGGPAAYDQIGFDWLAQALAEHGYLVIQPQFRGSVGFGDKHYAAGQGQWGKKMQDDLTDAVHNFSKLGVIDPERVCIVGGSYGGYAALAGGAFTPDLYRCVVSIAGVSDLNELLDYERKKHGDDHWVVSYFENSVANGKYTEEQIDALSPINYAKNFKAPVLLIHGEHDEVVPVEQSDDMYDELDDADKEVKFIELDNENHHLMKGKTRLKAMAAVLKFVDKYLAAPKASAKLAQ